MGPSSAGWHLNVAGLRQRDESYADLTISFSWMELEFGKQYVASDEAPMQDLLVSLESFCKVRLHGLELLPRASGWQRCAWHRRSSR